MVEYTREGLLELTKRLCAIPSVSGNAGEENACADEILKELAGVRPANGNTFRAWAVPCRGDRLGRKAVMALLRSAGGSPRTVLLTGHFDVVSPAACGDLEALSFDLDGYTRELAKRGLDGDAGRDLASGNWLFGRGSMDMKAGLAIFIAAIGKLAGEKDLPVNIAFLAVPDEEADSAGMRGALPALLEMIRSEGLEMAAALTGEPCFWTQGGNAARPYYTGTTGKIMPIFVAVGREAHVGCYYEGVSAASIAAAVVREVEASPDIMDRVGGEVLPPPACLSLEVRRHDYSVTLPGMAACYFNVLTAYRTPAEVLEWSRGAAGRALEDCLSRLRVSAAAYREKGGEAQEIPSGRVYTVAEAAAMAAERLGGRETLALDIEELCRSLAPETDAREVSVRAAERIIELSGIRGPAVVTGFVPPYYPPRVNRRRTGDERLLREVIEEVVTWGGRLAGDGAVKVTEIFSGITDLSYLGFDGRREDLEPLRENMPGWGAAWELPVGELLELDVPVANMGPAGKDAHQATERLELAYSFEIAPKMLLETVRRLGRRL